MFLVNLPTKEKVYSYGSTNKAYCRSDKHHDKCPYQRYGNVVDEKLQDLETGLYYESSGYNYELLKDELKNRKIVGE